MYSQQWHEANNSSINTTIITKIGGPRTATDLLTPLLTKPHVVIISSLLTWPLALVSRIERPLANQSIEAGPATVLTLLTGRLA